MDAVRAPRGVHFFVAAFAALVALCLALPAVAGAAFQRGVAYTGYTASGYGAPASDASLARVAQDGNSDVAIVVTVYEDNKFSNTMAANATTPTDASLLHAMQTARSLGLHVTLKPHIDLVSGGWRGGILPSDPAQWFANYQQMIDHYADLAQQGGASMFEVGTELKTMSSYLYTDQWKKIISDVRQRFSGQLTYAANYDEFQQIGFWPQLDYIGIDAYWPIANASDQPVSSLLSAWSTRGYLGTLQRAAAYIGHPILFTEVGYRSVVGATIHPNLWDTTAKYDMQEQANAYESVYEALAHQPWFAGLYWWQWPAALPANGWNGDYSPIFKPAETIMQSWNAQLAPPPPAAAPVPAADVAPATQSSALATRSSAPAPAQGSHAKHKRSKHRHVKHKRSKHKRSKRHHHHR